MHTLRQTFTIAIVLALIGASPAWAGTRTQEGDIVVPASGNAAPFPSGLLVGGEPGSIADVNLTLSDITHTYADDLDVLPVSPEGQAVLVLSDACGNTDLQAVTFDDEASEQLNGSDPFCPTTGTFRPTDYADAPDVFAGGAPPPPAAPSR